MAIQLPDLWNAFKKRFELDDQQPKPLELNTTVQPVTVIDSLMDMPEIVYDFINVTGANYYGSFMVPDGEYWDVLGLSVLQFGAVCTFSTIRIMNFVVARGALAVALDTFPIIPIRIDEGYRVFVDVDSFTSAGNIKVTLLVTKHQKY